MTRFTVRVKTLLALEYWSAAPMVKVNVPAVFGVPERVPVDALSVRPAGRSPETCDHVRDSSESEVKVWE